MKAHFRITHFTFNLSFRYQSRYRVNYNYINRARSDQVVCDFKRLLTVIWLRDQEIVYIYTQFFCITFIKSMLRVNYGGNSTFFLSLGNDMCSQSSLTGRFRAIDFDDSSFWNATYP